MKETIKSLAIVATVLAFSLISSMAMVGCDDKSSGGNDGAVVTGIVVNSAALPQSDVVVTINTVPPQDDTTGANGVYRFENIPVGSFTLTMAKTGFVNTTINITVEEGFNVNSGNTSIVSTSEQVGGLSGRILSGTDSVSAAEVQINKIGVNVSYATYTDSIGPNKGVYTFTSIPVGSYKMVVARNGYVTDSSNVSITANTVGTNNRTITESAILTGNLTGARTLKANVLYTLQGFYQISPGAVLTIPAGTRIEAEPGTQAAIIALRASANGNGTILKVNGQIRALGTAGAPVVFTTKAAAGSRARGLWGGIILNGAANINQATKVGVGEGNTGSYGPGGFTTAQATLDTMSSGILQYVRVEFGGIKVTPDNEINGFTFNGVGSNTIVDHCQAHMVADDGFEFFGGTVNAKYLVSSGNDDDDLDTDNGYSGKIQFFVGIKDKTLGNRGMEADNDATGSANGPLSNPHVWNATFIGGNDVDDKNNDDNNEGLYWRRNTNYDANNMIVAYFNRYGLIFDGNADSLKAVNGTATLKNSILFNNKVNSKGEVAFKSTNYDTVGVGAVIATWNLIVQNPNFTSVNTASNGNAMNGTLPDPRPTSIVTGGTPPNDGFYDVSATHIGAFGATNWMSGWTTWVTN